jgi:hypothetical protein
LNNRMNCWNISKKSANHNEAGDSKREGLKIADQRQSAAKLELRNKRSWSLLIEHMEHRYGLITPGDFFWRQRLVTALPTFGEPLFPCLMDARMNSQSQYCVFSLDDKVWFDYFEKLCRFMRGKFSSVALFVAKRIHNLRQPPRYVEVECISEPVDQFEIRVNNVNAKLDESVFGAVVVPATSVANTNTSLSVDDSSGVSAFQICGHVVSISGVSSLVKFKKVQRLGGETGTISHPRDSGTPIGGRDIVWPLRRRSEASDKEPKR